MEKSSDWQHLQFNVFLVHQKTIVFGRAYVLLAFISSFFPLRNLRAPSVDRYKILHDTRRCVLLYNPGPKFRGGLPPKNLGAKNMQNLA